METSLEIKNEKVDHMKLLALQAQNSAQDLAIKTPDDYAFAGDLLVKIKQLGRGITDMFKGVKSREYAVWKASVQQEIDTLKPLEIGEKIIQLKRREFEAIEEKERIKKEAVLQLEAKKQSDAEAIELANLAEQAGDKEEAQMILEEAAQSPPPTIIIPKEIPKTDGLYTTKYYGWRLKNIKDVKPEYFILDKVGICQTF